MTETTRQILSALDAAAEGAPVELVLSAELYPGLTVEILDEERDGWVTTGRLGTNGELIVSAVSGQPSPAPCGAVLNALLRRTERTS